MVSRPFVANVDASCPRTRRRRVPYESSHHYKLIEGSNRAVPVPSQVEAAKGVAKRLNQLQPLRNIPAAQPTMHPLDQPRMDLLSSSVQGKLLIVVVATTIR